jgi:hypothetical protein
MVVEMALDIPGLQQRVALAVVRITMVQSVVLGQPDKVIQAARVLALPTMVAGLAAAAAARVVQVPTPPNSVGPMRQLVMVVQVWHPALRVSLFTTLAAAAAP